VVEVADGGAEPFTVDLRAIEVDLQGLDDFARLLREEVDANLRPYSDQIIGEHRGGVGFGLWSASNPLHDTRRDYHDCLTSAVQGLRSYIDASEVLLSAIDKVATHYRHTDAMSSAQAAEVQGALGAAQLEMQAKKAAAEAEEARRETERETRRGQT